MIRGPSDLNTLAPNYRTFFDQYESEGTTHLQGCTIIYSSTASSYILYDLSLHNYDLIFLQTCYATKHSQGMLQPQLS